MRLFLRLEDKQKSCAIWVGYLLPVTLLLSIYSFGGASKLLILNLHAINFREIGRYNKELDRFVVLMQDHEGSIIVAGDFNSWNKKRMQKLDEITEKLSLKRVPFGQIDKVKSFMGNHLDYILYKGVELLDFKVQKSHGLSDHNPLFAQFKKVREQEINNRPI